MLVVAGFWQGRMLKTLSNFLLMAVFWGMGAVMAQACMKTEALPFMVRTPMSYPDVATVREHPPVVEAKIGDDLVLTLPKTRADDLWKIQNLAQIERSFALRVEDTPSQTTFTLKYLNNEGLSEQKKDEQLMRAIVLQRPLELVYRHAGRDGAPIQGQLLVLTNLERVIYPEVRATLIEVNAPVVEAEVTSRRLFQINFARQYEGSFTWRVKSAVAEAYDRENKRMIFAPLELKRDTDKDGRQFFEGEGTGEQILIELQAEGQGRAEPLPGPVKIIIRIQPTPTC